MITIRLTIFNLSRQVPCMHCFVEDSKCLLYRFAKGQLNWFQVDKDIKLLPNNFHDYFLSIYMIKLSIFITRWNKIIEFNENIKGMMCDFKFLKDSIDDFEVLFKIHFKFYKINFIL